MDELKRRNVIDPEAYRRVNDYLSAKQGLGLTEGGEDSEIDEEDNEIEEIESKISDTIQYLIQHDRNELQELFELFEKKGDIF